MVRPAVLSLLKYKRKPPKSADFTILQIFSKKLKKSINILTQMEIMCYNAIEKEREVLL